MLIYIGADHRGFEKKEIIKKQLEESGYEVVDFGAKTKNENDDYVDFAIQVGKTMSRDPSIAKGILVCGSGAGMDIVVNKFRGVRSSLCFSSEHAMAVRNDDDVNVLVLPADFIDDETAKKITATWLQTPFSQEERHSRRLEKIDDLERSTISYYE